MKTAIGIIACVVGMSGSVMAMDQYHGHCESFCRSVTVMRNYIEQFDTFFTNVSCMSKKELGRKGVEVRAQLYQWGGVFWTQLAILLYYAEEMKGLSESCRMMGYLEIQDEALLQEIIVAWASTIEGLFKISQRLKESYAARYNALYVWALEAQKSLPAGGARSRRASI